MSNEHDVPGGRNMKSARLWLQIGHRLCMGLLVTSLTAPQALWGQLPKSVVSPQQAQSKAPEQPEDTLARSTPRGTVLGFLAAAYDEKYDVAAQYLNTQARGNDADLLAKQLFFVLDHKLPAKLNNVSNDPVGSLSDPLDSRRELIGTVTTEGGSVDIYLERVTRPSGRSIWLFSRDTLVSIPDLFDEINAVTVQSQVPDALLKKYFGITLFGWSFFLIFLPSLYLVLTLFNRLAGAGVGYTLRHWARRPEASNPTIIPQPVRVLILSLTVFASLSKFSLSLFARQISSTIGIVLLIAAFVWSMFLLSGRCEAYMKKRMEKQGRLSSTVVLRPVRRVIDLLAAVVGLMFLLHTLGINPSATLAGLGVGGIAVALAAQKTLENIIGGASLIMDGVVRVGDFFKVGEVVGTVEAIGLRSTRVRTLDRTVVTIPNGQMASMTLENYSVRDQFWLRHLIGLAMRTPPSALNQILAEVRSLLDRDPRVLPLTTRVRFLRFTESSLELEVFAYIAAKDWNQFLEIQEELLMRIREIAGAIGVEIAYPTRSIYLKGERESSGVVSGQLRDSTDAGKGAFDEMPNQGR
ncbi:MAG: mechanosensitive ion channel family protein [Terracidiphilus sp.]